MLKFSFIVKTSLSHITVPLYVYVIYHMSTYLWTHEFHGLTTQNNDTMSTSLQVLPCNILFSILEYIAMNGIIRFEVNAIFNYPRNITLFNTIIISFNNPTRNSQGVPSLFSFIIPCYFVFLKWLSF